MIGPLRRLITGGISIGVCSRGRREMKRRCISKSAVWQGMRCKFEPRLSKLKSGPFVLRELDLDAPR